MSGLENRSALVAAAVLVAALSLFWVHRVHIDAPTASSMQSADLDRYFYPTAVHMHRELRRGHLSLWNPHQMAGMPFLATHISGPLYPPNIVLLTLLRPARAIEVHALLHLLLAGTLMWLLARRLGSSAVASVAAALAFVFSGAMLGTLYQPTYLSTSAWIPGVLWAVHGLVSEAKWRWALALAAMLAMAFLGGHSQGLLFEVQLGVLYALAMLLARRPRHTPRVLGLAAAAGLIVAGLSAAQLLPSLELVNELPRVGDGLSLEDAALLQLPPAAVSGGLIGRGHPGFRVAALAAPLLLLGWADRPRRRQWLFFALVSLGSALFAMGTRTPVFPLYHALPGGDLFRVPARIAFVYAFAVALGIGFGIDGVRALLRRWLPSAPALGLGFAVALAGVGFGDLYARSRLPARLPIHVGETRGAPAPLLDRLAQEPHAGRVFIENYGGHYAAPLPHLVGMMNELYAVPTYEPMIPRAYASYFEQDASWRGLANVVRNHQRRFSFTRSASIENIPLEGLRRRLDLMSVRFYATEAPLARRRIADLEAFVGARAHALGQGRLLERREAMARVYVVHDVVVEREPEQALAILQSASFDPRQSVVAAAPIPGLDSGSDSGREPAGGRDRAEITSYAPEEVRLRAECTTACVLVLTDLHYPGWQAWVDGDPTSIHLVNALFRGLWLESGTHEIVYRYQPRTFRIGAALSAATLFFVACAGVMHSRRAKRTRDTS